MHKQDLFDRTVSKSYVTADPGVRGIIAAVGLATTANLNVPPTTDLFASAICSTITVAEKHESTVCDHVLGHYYQPEYCGTIRSSTLATTPNCFFACSWPRNQWWFVLICSVLNFYRFRISSSASIVSLLSGHQKCHYYYYSQHHYKSINRSQDCSLETRHWIGNLPDKSKQWHYYREYQYNYYYHQYNHHRHLLCLVLCLAMVFILCATTVLPGNAFTTDSDSSLPSATSYYNPPAYRDHHRHHPVQK